jgi:hypothetical protein
VLVLPSVRECYAYDLSDLVRRLRTARTDFPALADETVTLARDDPAKDRNAASWAWGRLIFVPDDRRLSNVTLYHELGHLAIRVRVERGEDLPQTSERFCSIFAMARMPSDRVDEDRIPYLGAGEVSRGLYPRICRAALGYREHNHDYIKQCRWWLAGEWDGRPEIGGDQA